MANAITLQSKIYPSGTMHGVVGKPSKIDTKHVYFTSGVGRNINGKFYLYQYRVNKNRIIKSNHSNWDFMVTGGKIKPLPVK